MRHSMALQLARAACIGCKQANDPPCSVPRRSRRRRLWPCGPTQPLVRVACPSDVPRVCRECADPQLTFRDEPPHDPPARDGVPRPPIEPRRASRCASHRPWYAKAAVVARVHVRIGCSALVGWRHAPPPRPLPSCAPSCAPSCRHMALSMGPRAASRVPHHLSAAHEEFPRGISTRPLSLVFTC